MDQKGKGKRLFSACILSLMTMLAIGTMAFADGDSSSYMLVIRKLLAADTDPGLAEQLKTDKTKYTFRVQGVSGKGEEKKPVNKEVSIQVGEESLGEGNLIGEIAVPVEAATAITVVELTGHTEVNGWYLSTSDFTSAMKVNNERAVIQISRPNGRLVIEKPEARVIDGESYPNSYTYRVTGPLANNPELTTATTEGGATQETTIRSGGSTTFTGLAPGYYIIEEMQAQKGYYFQVENDPVTVPAGGSQSFEIKGKGKITATAPNDGRVHRYELYKGGQLFDTTEGVLDVQPGASVTRENLPAGTYTVKEAPAEGISGVTITAPVTSVTSTTIATSATPIGKMRKITTGGSAKSGDYTTVAIGMIKGPASKETVRAQIKGTWVPDDYTDGSTYFFTGTVGYRTSVPYRLNPGYFYIGYAPGKLNNDKITQYNVYSILHKTSSNTITGSSGKISAKTEHDQWGNTVDEGEVELTFTKPVPPADQSWMSQLQYSYQIQRSYVDCDETVVVSPGESKKIKVPATDYNGSYTITETLLPFTSDFTIQVTDDSSTTVQQGVLSGTIMANGGRLTLTKPPVKEGDTDVRTYYYKVTRPNGQVVDVELKAGESINGEFDHLMAGTFNISPEGYADTGFKLTFSDRNLAVLTDGRDAAVITVTNNYTKEIGGYHEVHEYYYRHPDGTLEQEYTSEIIPRHGKEIDTVFTADNVTKMTVPANGKGHVYAYFECAYGSVQGEIGPLTGAQPTRYLDSGEPPRYTDSGSPPEESPGDVSPGSSLVRYTDSGPAPAVRSASGQWRHADSYQAEDGKDHVKSTKYGDEVIILRYLRQDVPVPTIGKYRVVHTYYLRDHRGDHFDGNTEQTFIEELPLDSSLTYDEDTVDRRYRFKNLYGKTYRYAYDGAEYGEVRDSSYVQDTNKNGVIATTGGDQIIVLRYVRTPFTPEEKDEDDPPPPTYDDDDDDDSGEPSRPASPPAEPPRNPDTGRPAFPWQVLLPAPALTLLTRRRKRE